VIVKVDDSRIVVAMDLAQDPAERFVRLMCDCED
jgi:hypothetical protein